MRGFSDAPEPLRRTVGESVRVLCVDDDPEYLDLVESYLDDHGFEVRTETTPEAVTDRLDDVDCLVSDYVMPGMDGLELLEVVRERDPALPFVLFTGESREGLAGSVADRPATAFLRKGKPDATVPLLVRRIRRLVTFDRLATVATRSLTALEAANDAVAVVGPDGTFEFANQAYLTRLGYESDELVGRHWHDCFPDDDVSRIESRALPTVEDGWQWTGQCVGLRRDGERVAGQTRIAGLDDGSLVICHPRSRDGE